MLFAVNLDLRAALPLIGDRHAAEKVSHAISELDRVIEDLRTTILDSNSQV
jgi:hypothetical protein